jgi:hypothetical protein
MHAAARGASFSGIEAKIEGPTLISLINQYHHQQGGLKKFLTSSVILL